MECCSRRQCPTPTAGRRWPPKRVCKGANAPPQPPMRLEGAEGKAEQSLDGKQVTFFPFHLFPLEKDEKRKKKRMALISLKQRP